MAVIVMSWVSLSQGLVVNGVPAVMANGAPPSTAAVRPVVLATEVTVTLKLKSPAGAAVIVIMGAGGTDCENSTPMLVVSMFVLTASRRNRMGAPGTKGKTPGKVAVHLSPAIVASTDWIRPLAS